MKRYDFLTWAGKWCRETNNQLCGKVGEGDQRNDVIESVTIRVLMPYGFGFKEIDCRLYAGDVAEVCGYIDPRTRFKRKAWFVKGGDLCTLQYPIAQ